MDYTLIGIIFILCGIYFGGLSARKSNEYFKASSSMFDYILSLDTRVSSHDAFKLFWITLKCGIWLLTLGLMLAVIVSGLDLVING